jgi:hypothetical protein
MKCVHSLKKLPENQGGVIRLLKYDVQEMKKQVRVVATTPNLIVFKKSGHLNGKA